MRPNFYKGQKMAKRKKKEAFDWGDEAQEEIIWVSKSEIKRDAEDLKQLGEKIVNLTKANLLDGIELAQRLQKEARRRQLQYIGKLFRGIDIAPIREALDKIENKHNQQQAMLHKIEKIRDELIENGDIALTNLLNNYPEADRQKLRNLIRSAQKEREQNKPSKAYRDIYQMLKSLMLED